jgi:DtxR family Mn-dependent transcriptional regulator
MKGLSASLEDYLEAIWVEGLGKPVVRVKDLAKSLDVKPPSVIEALKTLVDKGLVTHERYGYVELTEKGAALASSTYERHQTLSKFFHEILDVDLETASRDACRIEHYLDRKTMDRLVKFVKFVETCPEGEPGWLSSFQEFAKTGKRTRHCNERSGRSR